MSENDITSINSISISEVSVSSEITYVEHVKSIAEKAEQVVFL